MKTRYLLCDICKEKIQKAEAQYKSKRRKIKVKEIKRSAEKVEVKIK